MKTAWIPVHQRMPKPGQYVLAHFLNEYGKSRIVRAFHAPQYTIEANGEWFELDPDEDDMWLPEGWYECNEYEDTHWYVDGDITHWMPLPKTPKKEGER